MCGIVGYVGGEQAVPALLKGLSKLEYRGYDSAGVAVLDKTADGTNLETVKTKGRIAALEDMLRQNGMPRGCVGVGHTRWATHGAPSDKNSHPHVGGMGKIAVVHNGIIENYMQIKSFLTAKGVGFVSETDTEVIAQLVEYYYTGDSAPGDILDAVIRVIERLEGAYALGIVCADEPDKIIAVKKDAPLIIGIGGDCMYMASDVTALIQFTRDVYYLNDREIAVLTRDSAAFYNIDRDSLKKKIFRVDWDVSAAEKGGYEHFMFKEIMEQPKAISDTISPRIADRDVRLDGLKLTDAFIGDIDKIFITACGSAYHVGMAGKIILESMTRVPVETQLASEFRYGSPIVTGRTLVIIISQSGETADTLAALREAKRLGAYTLSIVNVVGSSIANESDDVLYTWAGPEIAVATTKAYITQLALLYLVGLHLGRALGRVSEDERYELISELRRIPEKIEGLLARTDELQYFASQHYNADSVFYIGRNLDFCLSLEASLKLKEISYIHSEAYAAGELKHGTISLIEPGSLVIAICTNHRLFDKMMSNIREVEARGACVMAVASEDMGGIDADTVFALPKTHSLLTPLLAVVPLQLFAYYVASLKGCDIDKPRNLAKSVTVE